MSSISVLVPTVGRDSLARAVSSALSQGPSVKEVIVAADTAGELELPDDPRVLVTRVGPGAGGNVARNAAITQATGDVIALLDDDDYWSEGRLRRFESYRLRHSDAWIYANTCHLSDGTTYPPRLPKEGEDPLRYLFTTVGLPPRKGAMVTSTLILPRWLAMSSPFDPSLRFHQDLDWLIALFGLSPDTRYIVDSTPLVSVADTPGSVAKSISVEQSLDWAKKRLLPIEGRLYSDFVLSRTPLRRAVNDRDLAAWRRVVGAALSQKRRPSLGAVFYAIAYSTRMLRPGRNVKKNTVAA